MTEKLRCFHCGWTIYQVDDGYEEGTIYKAVVLDDPITSRVYFFCDRGCATHEIPPERDFELVSAVSYLESKINKIIMEA